jgi:RHS repeat-associated protein
MEQTEDLIRAVVETLSVAGVTLNGIGAESVDASGRFFTSYVVQPGPQTITVAAYDTRGVSVSRDFTIIGYDANDTNDVLMADLGDTLELEYSGLTFRPSDNVLVADAAVANRSGYAQRGPFEARILEVHPSTASILNPDRVHPDGVPVVLLDPHGLDLAPNATGTVVQVAIANPERERITLRTEIRGRANQVPRYTSVPPPAVTVSNPWSYNIGVIDDDGDPFDLALIEHPATMTLVGSVLNWTPTSGDVGYHGVRVRTEDSRGGRAEQVFQILVEENVPNRTPVFYSVPMTSLASGTDYLYVPDVRDPDGDTLAFQMLTPPPGFAVDPANGTVSYPTIPDGVYSLELEADDGNGGVAVQRFDLSVGLTPANPSAPMILTTPPSVAVVGQTYQYFPSAYDPDGDPLTFSLPTAPSGIEINSANGHITWVPTTNQIGAHTVLLRADDPGGLYASQFFTINVQTTALNRTPLITGFPSGYATGGEPYERVIAAEDPDANPLTFALELAPVGMAIDAASGTVTWLPPAGSTGMHTARVAVADTKGATAYLTWFIDVRASNTPPVFVSTPPTSLPAGATYRYTARAIDAEDAVSYILLQGPRDMTVDPALGVVRWVTGFSDIGAIPVRIGAVDDRGLMTEQSFTLTVAPDTTPPEVMVSISSLYVNPGETITVRVTALDDVGVVALRLLVDEVDTPLDGSGSVDIVPTTPGLLSVAAYAEDAQGNIGVYEIALRVFDPADTNPPDIVITSPANQAGVAMYFAVEGEISDPEGNLDFYTIDIARADRLNHIEPFVLDLNCDDCFTELVRVHISSANGVLGYIDPTVYPNDDYVIRVTAFDMNGQGWSEGVLVSIEGQMKPGQFTLDFTDVRIPTRGVPIEIVRRYDSLRRESLDAFGFGWSILAQDPDIRETVRDDILPYSTISLYPMYVGARVYLNDPDGYRVGYTFDAPFAQSSLIGTLYSPEYNPDPGVFDQLSDPIENMTVTLRNGGEAFLPLIPLPYNPSQYQLTRRDGTIYLYDQYEGLQQVTDRFGNTVTYGRNLITHSDGYSLSIQRDELGRVVSIASIQGVMAAYEYDDAGNLATHTDAENRTTQFLYYDEPPHALHRIIGPDGQILHEGEFDAAGRMVRQSGGGSGFEREFDPGTFTGVDRDIYGRESLITYNVYGLIIQVDHADGRVSTFTYDDQQRLIERSEDGKTQTLAYDDANRIVSYSNAIGQEWTYSYLPGEITMVDPKGGTTAFTLSPDNRITSVTRPSGATRSMTYDDQGRVTQLINENGNIVHLRYGDLNVPEEIEWQDGSVRKFGWQPGGVIDFMEDEEGFKTLFEQDPAGAITRVADSVGNVMTMEFDGRSRIASRLTGPEGQSFWREDLFDADDMQIGYQYHMPNGELIRADIVPGIPSAVTHFVGPGVSNAWSIAENGSTTTVQDADGQVATFTFNGDRIQSYTDRMNRQRIYRYDDSNQLIQEIWMVDDEVTNDIRIVYDAAGYPIQISDYVAQYTYTRDADHRIVHYSAVGVSNNLPAVSFDYTYDGVGNVVTAEDQLGVVVTSRYDVKEELVERLWELPGHFEARVEVTRDKRGLPVRFDRYADHNTSTASVTTLQSWDFAMDVSELRHLNGGNSNTLSSFIYDYSPSRLVTQVSEQSETTLYTHDPLGQILSAERSLGPDEAFEWDDGNPVGSSVVLGLENRLLEKDNFVMTYDIEGNMISRSNKVSGVFHTFAYDVANRLVEIVAHDGAGAVVHTVRNSYDAFGRRLIREVDGVPTYTIYDFMFAHADLDAQTNVVAVYLNSELPDQRYGRYRPSEGIHWYLADRKSSVRQLANESGNVVCEIDYLTFGSPYSVTDTNLVDRFLFAGRDYDEIGGLYHIYYRHYDPVLGRFTSPDPVRYRLGEYNVYRYAVNNPVDVTDWLGLGPAIEYPWPLMIQSFIVGCVFSVGESFGCDVAKAATTGAIGGMSGGSGALSGAGAGLVDEFSKEKGQAKVTGYLYDCAIGGLMNAVTAGAAGGSAGNLYSKGAREYSRYGETLAIERAMRQANNDMVSDTFSAPGAGKALGKCIGSFGMDQLGDNKPPDWIGKPAEALVDLILFLD